MARDHADYYYVRWNAFAVVDGTRVEIASFVVDYALDEIPTAQIYPVVGREPSTDKEAEAYDVLLQALPNTSIQLYVKGDPQANDNPNEELPGFIYGEDQLVFDGYLQGVGFRQSRSPAGGSATLRADAIGWLGALIGTSGQTAGSTVKSPGAFADICNVGLGAGQNPAALFDTTNAIVGSPQGAVTDLWLQFIKPLFQALLDSDQKWGNEENDSANDALSRMDLPPFGAADSPNALPIGINAGSASPTLIARAIGENMARSLFSAWMRSNLWDALMHAREDFRFHVVPLINTASCCPVFGALGGEPFVTITPNDYNDIDLSAKTTALISKLVVTLSLGGTSSPFSPTPVTGAVAGFFSAEEMWSGAVSINVRGLTVNQPAPPWMETAATVGQIHRYTTGRTNSGIPDVCNPQAFVVDPPFDYQAEINKILDSELGNSYAEAVLKEMLLSPRHGGIKGRFRLDVAPGSLVKVQLIGSKFSQFNTADRFVYGMVRRVRATVNSGLAQASGDANTLLELKYVRNETEHTGLGQFLTSDAHPLYRQRYVGSKLWNG